MQFRKSDTKSITITLALYEHSQSEIESQNLSQFMKMFGGKKKRSIAI